MKSIVKHGILLCEDGYYKWTIIRVIDDETREVFHVTDLVLFETLEESKRGDQVQKEEHVKLW